MLEFETRIQELIERIEYEVRLNRKALELLKRFAPESSVTEATTATESERRQPPRRTTKPKRPKRQGKKTYCASQVHIKKCLEEIGTPVTPFIIRNKLIELFNISVAEEKIKEQLHKAKDKLFIQTDEGIWELKAGSDE